jgi:hypothetical protein
MGVELVKRRCRRHLVCALPVTSYAWIISGASPRMRALNWGFGVVRLLGRGRHLVCVDNLLLLSALGITCYASSTIFRATGKGDGRSIKPSVVGVTLAPG